MGCGPSAAAIKPHAGDSQDADRAHSLPHALPSGVAGNDTTQGTTAWTHAASATLDPASPSSSAQSKTAAIVQTRTLGTFPPPDSDGTSTDAIKHAPTDSPAGGVVADEHNLSFSHTSVPEHPHSSSSGAERGSPNTWAGERRVGHAGAIVTTSEPVPTHADKYAVREHVVTTDASTLSLLSAGGMSGVASSNTLLLGSMIGNLASATARTERDSPPASTSHAPLPGAVSDSMDVTALEPATTSPRQHSVNTMPSVSMAPSAVETASVRSPAAVGGLNRGPASDVVLLPARFVALPVQCYEASHECKVKEKERGYKRVNELVMLQVLGRGAYGKVRKARIDAASVAEYREALQRHPESGSEWVAAELLRLDAIAAALSKQQLQPRFVAVKIIRKSTLRRKRVGRFGNALQSVLREADVWKRLQHPHVLRLHGVIDDASSDKMYFVSELMEGGSVMPDAKTAPPLHPADAARFFAQLLDALTYLHRLGVLHRDVKPGNCLLTHDGRLCLADFGTVYVFEGSDDSLRSTAGTPAFLAPEMLTGGIFSGRGQDAWAAGMTLYMMLHGCAAFAGDTVPTLYENIRTAPVPWPQPGADDAARSLVMSLLERDVHKRATLESAAQHEWLLMRGGNFDAVSGVRSHSRDTRNSTSSTPTLATPATHGQEPPVFIAAAVHSVPAGVHDAAPAASRSAPASPAHGGSPIRRRSINSAPSSHQHGVNVRSMGFLGALDDDLHRSPQHASLPPLSPTSAGVPGWSSAREVTAASPHNNRARTQLQRLQVVSLSAAAGDRNKARLRVKPASTENGSGAGSLFVSSGSEFVTAGPSRASPGVSEDSEQEIGAVIDSPHGSIASLNYSVASAMVSPGGAAARGSASRNMSVHARPLGSARSATRSNGGVALPGGLAAVIAET